MQIVTTLHAATTDTGAPARHAPLDPPGRVATGLSVALAVVAALAAALTVFVPDVLTGPPVMNGSARGTALVVLVLAVPVLVLSIALVRGGWVRALPVWIGAVAFLAYNGVLFLFATPFDDLFLVYVAMLGLAVWSLVALLHGLDVERFASLFDAQTPVRPVAVYVWVIVALNTLAWLAPVLRATAADGPPSFLVGTGMTTNPIFVQDLVFWLPAMALGAAWLWRRAAWGYVVVSAGLALWVVESVSVAVDQWVGHAADPSSAVASAAVSVPFGVLALIGLVPLGAMLRGLPTGPRASWVDGLAPGRWGWSLVAVQVFVGANAVFGGIQMAADGFGMPTEWLDGTGFASWVLPGSLFWSGLPSLSWWPPAWWRPGTGGPSRSRSSWAHRSSCGSSCSWRCCSATTSFSRSSRVLGVVEVVLVVVWTRRQGAE